MAVSLQLQNKKPNVSSNTEVILLDSNLNQLVTGNRFLGLDRITFNKKDLNHIRQLHVVNSYGQDEIYRVVLTEMNIDSVSTNIKYAAILINTSQLEQISQKPRAVNRGGDGKFLDSIYFSQSLSCTCQC